MYFHDYALKSALLFGIVLFMPNQAMSQQQEDLFSLSLEDLLSIEISTASLRNQPSMNAPSKVIVISRTTINDRNYRYLADVIKDLPAVRLSLYAASADSGGSEMIVRGIRGNNKVVLMWNGQRLNHPDSQPLHLTPYLYPLSDIQQIEIIYGSTSALYGSDTVSMTINMISSNANDLGDNWWSASIDSGNNSEMKGYVHYAGKLGKAQVAFLIDSYKTGGIDFSGFDQFYSRYPDGPGVNASYTYFPKSERLDFYNPSEASLLLRGRLELDEFDIQAYFQRFQTQTQIGWSPIIYEADGASGEYIFKQLGFFLNHKLHWTDRVTLESLLDHTRNQLDPNSHWSRPNTAPFLVYSNTLEPRGTGTKTYKLNFGNRTKIEERIHYQNKDDTLHGVIGLSFSSVDMMPKSANLDRPGSYDNSFSSVVGDVQKFHNLSETNLGIYVQAQYDYSKALSFTAGARMDEHSRYGSTINPRVVVNYVNQSGNWFAKAILGSSHLAPAAFFTFDTFLVPRDSQQVPNTDLEPEKTTSVELNFGKSNDWLTIEMSMFYTQIKNLIMQRQVKSIELLEDEEGPYDFTTFHTINSGKTTISGASLEFKGQLADHLLTYASITRITGETADLTNDGLSYDLIHTPANQAKLGLGSYWLDSRLNLYIEAQFTGKAKYHPDNYRLPASDNHGKQFEMDDFWLFGAGGRYQITPNLSLRFDIQNVTDTAYEQPIVGQETSSWTRISSTPGLPRQYYIGLTARFD